MIGFVQMAMKKTKWVVYEFKDGQHVIIGKPHASRKAAEKARDKMSPPERGKRSLSVGRISFGESGTA